MHFTTGPMLILVAIYVSCFISRVKLEDVDMFTFQSPESANKSSSIPGSGEAIHEDGVVGNRVSRCLRD